MKSDVKMDIRLPSELKDQLNEEAKRQDRSKAWITIKALQEYLSKKESEK